MKKFTLALAALCMAGVAFADEPVLIPQNAVAQLTDGGTYYIYDANEGRYGFFGDQTDEINGPHVKPAEAYAQGSLQDAKYVWTATATEDGNWKFQNVATSKYIDDDRVTGDAPAAFTLNPRSDEDYNIFYVKNVATNQYWNANLPGNVQFAYWSDGHPIMFYEAEAGENNVYNFVTVEAYTVTCNFMYEDEVVDTQSFTGEPGSYYQFTAPRYYKLGEYAEYDMSGYVGTEHATVEIECVGMDLPFAWGETVEDAKYAAIYMHASAGNTSNLVYDATAGKVVGKQNEFNQQVPFAAEYSFSFIGNLKNGFKLYNKAAGKALKKEGDATVLAELSDATVWKLGTSDTQSAEKFFVLRPIGADGNVENTCMNIQPVNGGWELKYWGEADNGSTMWAYGEAEPVLDQYTALFTQAKTTYADFQPIVELADVAIKYVAGINRFEPVAEDVMAMLQAFTTVPEKVLHLAALFAASCEPDFYMDYFSQFQYAESPEEIDYMYNDLMGTATMLMQSAMEFGATWKNNRTERYMTAVVDEEGAVSFKLAAEQSLNAFWKAEFIGGSHGVGMGGEENPADRTFNLYNPVAKVYVGVQTTDNTAVPAATSKENAAKLKLVPGDKGFELIVLDGEVENNFLNASYQPEDAPLVVFQQPNDEGAFWSMAGLPSFTDAQKQSCKVTFTGETSVNEWGGECYNNITGVQIWVPVGATPTEVGNFLVYYSDPVTWQQVNYMETPIAMLLEGVVPTQETITLDLSYYDPTIGQWGEYVELYEDVTVDVYNVTFETPITTPNYYVAGVSSTAFAITDGEGNTTYMTEEFASEAEIPEPIVPFDLVVTPEEGEVAELVNITFNSDVQFGYNWDCYEQMALIYNDEEAVFRLYSSQVRQYASFDFDDETAPQFTIPVADAAKFYVDKLTENAEEGDEIPAVFEMKPGRYMLYVPEGFFADGVSNPSNEFMVYWTVVETDGILEITDVTVNGKVYDMQGRQVAKPGKGIYIINGKKTLVK